MAGTAGALDGPAYALDASALLAFLKGEPPADDVAALLRRARVGETALSVTAVNAGEVLVVQERLGGAEASHRTLDLLQALPLEVVPVDLELAARAAWLKVRAGIGYADCFAAALAHRDGCPLVTLDPDFERVHDLVAVAWLPTP